MIRTRLFLAALFGVACVSMVACSSTEKTAAQIHNEAIVLDAHNDVIFTSILKGLDIGRRLDTNHTDIPRLQEGGVDVQVFAVFSYGTLGKGKEFAHANEQIDALLKVINANPDKIALAKTDGEIQELVKQKKIAAVIGIEGGHMIEDRLDYLDSLAARGARYMTLTWNNSTSWASSAADEVDENSGLTQKGLNDLGRDVVRRMNALGVVPDLSHVGRRTFFDVLEVTTKPVLVTHSNVYKLAPHPRNLEDDQILAIKENGGVIGINFFSAFLVPGIYEKVNELYAEHFPDADQGIGEESKYFSLPHDVQESIRPPLSVIFDHIDYFVDLIGVDHVGLGSDFDGIFAPPLELDDVSDFPVITAGLLERGYSESDIKKILGGNMLRVLKANER